MELRITSAVGLIGRARARTAQDWLREIFLYRRSIDRIIHYIHLLVIIKNGTTNNRDFSIDGHDCCLDIGIRSISGWD
jgi:hypothetical protein